jgi:2-polyprenyl-6-methoxyphenol hydroxylase-like FAD-dependent oxidoreductase
VRVTTGTRAIIVGGGIGGLSAAIALRRVGIDATVFERMDDVRVGSGLTIWTNAMKALHRLGVGEAVQASGTPIERVETRTSDGKLLASVPVGQLGRKLGQQSAGVQRADLLAVLWHALDDRVIQRGATCISYEQDENGVTAHFAHGRQVRGDLLIGADGINSTIRAQCLGMAEPRYAGYVGWGSDAKLDIPQYAPGTMVISHGRGSAFGIIPAGPGTVAWFGTVRTTVGAGRQDAPDERKRQLLERFRNWHAPIEAILEATDASSIIRTDIQDREPVERWGEGRVTLLGDAAHPLIPTLGQGACLAIEDAVVLARCLSLGGDVSAALRLYENQRIARSASVQRQAWQLGYVFHRESRWGCALRDAFLRLQPSRPALNALERIVGYEA